MEALHGQAGMECKSSATVNQGLVGSVLRKPAVTRPVTMLGKDKQVPDRATLLGGQTKPSSLS